MNYENTIETNKQPEISDEAIEKMILQRVLNVEKEHLKKTQVHSYRTVFTVTLHFYTMCFLLSKLKINYTAVFELINVVVYKKEKYQY